MHKLIVAYMKETDDNSFTLGGLLRWLPWAHYLLFLTICFFWVGTTWNAKYRIWHDTGLSSSEARTCI